MIKLFLSKGSILLCCLSCMSPAAMATHHIIGKYHCVEQSNNKIIPEVKSELFISKAKDQYKFVWYYEDGTVYEGLSTSKNEPLSLIILKFIDMEHINFTEREPGVESFLIKENGKRLVGKFYNIDHLDDGQEECIAEPK